MCHHFTVNVILGVVFLKHQMLIIELGFKNNGICFTLHTYQMEMLGARVHLSLRCQEPENL